MPTGQQHHLIEEDVTAQTARNAALYWVVLERWRRCDREGALLASVLREADDEAKNLSSAMRAEADNRKAKARTEALGRFLGSHRSASLLQALHRWNVTCFRLAAHKSMAAVRQERAARMETEAQLVLAQESERTLRFQWQAQQQQELAIVSALKADGVQQPRQDSLRAMTTPSTSISSTVVGPVQCAPSTAPTLVQVDPKAVGRRAIGSRAESLLAAWEVASLDG